MNDPRVEAAASALECAVGSHLYRSPFKPDVYFGDGARSILSAADAADREQGIHRVRVDDKTVERVARVLFDQRDVGESGFGAWDDEEQGPSDEEKGWFLDDARTVLAALTGVES